MTGSHGQRLFQRLFVPLFLIGLATVACVRTSPTKVNPGLGVAEVTDAPPTPTAMAATALPNQMDMMTDMMGDQSAPLTGAAAEGASLFAGTCVACHGFDARGIPGLGKDLVVSEFVSAASDADLVAFIIAGRPATDPANTTGVVMPERGGNPALSDENLASIVAYLRWLQGGGQDLMAERPTIDLETFVLPIEGMDLSAAPPVDPFDPAFAYAFVCAGCHGLEGEGTPQNGPALVGNPLLGSAPDLLAFLNNPRPPQASGEESFYHPLPDRYPFGSGDDLIAFADALVERFGP
jgi:disulfide bond formation protein DsbB